MLVLEHMVLHPTPLLVFYRRYSSIHLRCYMIHLSLMVTLDKRVHLSIVFITYRLHGARCKSGFAVVLPLITVRQHLDPASWPNRPSPFSSIPPTLINAALIVLSYSPKSISAGMLKRPPTNLNQQSQNATILLIREVLAMGIQLSEVYVDALGKTTTYQAYLSSLFPDISFTVQAKADLNFKIVGAASVAAKVTRDAWIEGWVYEENTPTHELVQSKFFHNPLPASGEKEEAAGKQPKGKWVEQTGSGYPSDPKTQAWIKGSLEPTFGYPSFVRFSWSTVKVVLEKDGHAVEWYV